MPRFPNRLITCPCDLSKGGMETFSKTNGLFCALSYVVWFCFLAELLLCHTPLYSVGLLSVPAPNCQLS